MPPIPDNVASSEPLVEVLDNLIPAELHAAAWKACGSASWRFGHGSNSGDGSQFWKMDLDGDAALAAVWQHARARCEELAGSPLRVIRTYANGHTYGLGGRPHLDDARPGTFTLLYYPNPEWQEGWDGETMFYDGAGEVALAVRLRPNRAVFFDSRILHNGRAPSRLCSALRVSVAFKLEAVTTAAGTQIPELAGDAPEAREIQRDGAQRIYSVRIGPATVQRAVDEHLAQLGQTLRLPGYRQGNIPADVLAQRYGGQARAAVLNRLTTETIGTLLPQGSVPSAVDLKSRQEDGHLAFHVTATVLPELPTVEFQALVIERLRANEADWLALGLTVEDGAAAMRRQEKAQVLDFLDAAYRFPLRPLLVERELAGIVKAAEAQVEFPTDAESRASTTGTLRAIAERRVRLGLLLAELARRYELRARSGVELEDRVVDYLIAHGRVEERAATLDELRELSQA